MIQLTSELYKWEKWSGKLPDGAIYTSQYYVIARTKIDNNYKLARYSLGTSECLHTLNEYKTTKDFEILIAEPGPVVEWVTAYLGDYPLEGVPVGVDDQFIGRGKSGGIEKRLKPGYIVPKEQQLWVICETGRWCYDEYEALVIRDPSNLKAVECATPFSWYTWDGLEYGNAVRIGEKYVVAMSKMGSSKSVTFGQLNLENHQFKVVWENVIQSRWPEEVEVLVHNKDAIVEWVVFDCANAVPDNSIGYGSGDAKKYVGKISNAITASEYVPAIVDKGKQNCTYFSDGKIVEDKICEILVIKNAPKKKDYI